MATVNNRTMRAYHGGATKTTAVINGVDAGGLMSASLQFGYDNILTSPGDGLSFPEVDRLTQFCRGTIVTQDWIEILELLKGSVGTYEFYEKESGVETVSKYTLLNPVIHTASINFTHRGYATCTFSFECMASSETDALTNLLAVDNAAVAPVAATAVARGIEIITTVHTSAGPVVTDIYHVTGFTLNIAGQLQIASQDGDVGYTAADVIWGGQSMGGTLTFQDSTNTDVVKAATLLTLAEASGFVVTIKQSQAEAPGSVANKTLTLSNLLFLSGGSNHDQSGAYTGYTLDYVLNGDAGTPIGYDAAEPFTGDAAAVVIA